MNNSNHPAFVDFASIEEACEAQVEQSRRRLADTLPPERLEDALVVMRGAYQRCIAFGRSYGDHMVAAYGAEIRSVTDSAVTRFVDAALCEDMPELAPAIVIPDIVEATRMIVMMSAHERITAARMAHSRHSSRKSSFAAGRMSGSFATSYKGLRERCRTMRRCSRCHEQAELAPERPGHAPPLSN